MASASISPSELPLEQLCLYHVIDPCLSSIFVFYGSDNTANATVSSSRVQTHIFSPAGFYSYRRITVSPAAPLYAAVNRLPWEKQGNEACRGLAVSMLKFFTELSDPVKHYLREFAKTGKLGENIPNMFDEVHAANIANRLKLVDDASEAILDLRTAYQERKVPWIDVDIVLPPDTIRPPLAHDGDGDLTEMDQDFQYDRYSSVVRALGDQIFLPTSRLKRAPSRPTNLSKSSVFSRSQKEAFRLAMCEFVDTEERYVSKLYTLVHEVADQFRLRAQRRPATSTSPDETSLASLFPPCLDLILDVNRGFLGAVRKVLEETEQEAIDDISQDTDLQIPAPQRWSSRNSQKDFLGAYSFAYALVEWFPRFSQPYADYMRAHVGFMQTLNSFLRDRNSTFSKRVHETGEQKLRSLLMEPVQRLPRYSLLIDTMTGSLQMIHPAVRPFMKARDVIKDICSLDDAGADDQTQSLQKLKSLVGRWPVPLSPAGRLINAIDFNELPPPYIAGLHTPSRSTCIMLIFKNCLVLLSKTPECKITARALLSELDNSATTTVEPSASLNPGDLRVAQVLDINAVRYMQSSCGRIIFLAPASAAFDAEPVDLLALELFALHEGRASRLIEEITKARIEGRFSEEEREMGRWTLRGPSSGNPGSLGILACVFEEEREKGAMQRNGNSRIRMVFDMPRAACSEMLRGSDLEVVISVSSPRQSQFKLDIESILGTHSSDIATPDTFLQVLSKRRKQIRLLCWVLWKTNCKNQTVSHLLLPLHGHQNKILTEAIVHSNFEILRFVASGFIAPVKTARSLKPLSPSKLLSSLRGVSTKEHEASTRAKLSSSASLSGEYDKLTPSKSPHNRSRTLPSAMPKNDDDRSKISLVGSELSRDPLNDDIALLEQTFSAYVLALQSRSGNIVGRILRGREKVDRSAVNELYNILLGDPGKVEAAAEVPVEVLFVAFETFMAKAWRDRLGPVIDPASLRLIQSQFETMRLRDFEESFRIHLSDMGPQNARALAGTIRLLSELLDACGNDGDRGALTAAFAEVLTEEGDPMHHVSLLDRLVDDFGTLFDDFVPIGAPLEEILNVDPAKSPSRNSSSMASNSSSLRRRLGFGMHRETLKADGEGKVSSILRTLSKNKGSHDPELSTLRGSLYARPRIRDQRSPHPNSRPSSREQASVSTEELVRGGSCSQENLLSSPARGGANGNSRVGSVRRKRRSSLSDLRPLSTLIEMPSSSAGTPTNAMPSQVDSHPSPSPSRFDLPDRTGSPPPRPSTPSRKENIDPNMEQSKRYQALRTPTRENSCRDQAGSVKGTELKERPGLLNAAQARRLQTANSPPKSQKLRMQSPQKVFSLSSLVPASEM